MSEAGQSDLTLDIGSLMGPETSRTTHLFTVAEASRAGRFNQAIEAARRIDPPVDRTES